MADTQEVKGTQSYGSLQAIVRVCFYSKSNETLVKDFK